MATRIGLEVEGLFRRRVSAPGMLKHVLDPTVSGRPCKIPKEVFRGVDLGGRLIWDQRLGNIESPTVYSKDKWVRRHLTPKELTGVLDIPGQAAREAQDLKRLTRAMIVPGKVLNRTLEDMHELLTRDLKREGWDLDRSSTGKRQKLEAESGDQKAGDPEVAQRERVMRADDPEVKGATRT